MLREITENTELKLQTRTAWNQTGVVEMASNTDSTLQAQLLAVNGVSIPYF